MHIVGQALSLSPRLKQGYLVKLEKNYYLDGHKGSLVRFSEDIQKS